VAGLVLSEILTYLMKALALTLDGEFVMLRRHCAAAKADIRSHGG
jgi:hypothetical protein